MIDQLSKFDLGWLIGVWEGEGSCGCYKMKYQNRGIHWGTRYILAAEISQKEKSFIENVTKMIGFGRVEVVKYNKGFNEKEPIKMFKWKSNARAARMFLNTILPFVKSKRRVKQIKKALNLDKRYVRAWK